MTEQLAFNIYCYAIVGFLGNALIGWEFGKKGWIRMGLEGPKNRKLLFALSCFAFMILWQAVRKLDSPVTSWRNLWIPAWGFSVFTVSHLLVPKSMRLYSRAKFLHETTNVGDWRKPEVALEQIRTDWRLLKAESLYMTALQIQKRLSNQSETDKLYVHHQRNIAVTYYQLALLFLQQRHFEKAAAMAREAVSIAEFLTHKFPGQSELLSILSDVLFRDAEVEEAQGNLQHAKAKYRRSLDIDLKQRNTASADATKARLREIAEADSEMGTRQ